MEKITALLTSLLLYIILRDLIPSVIQTAQQVICKVKSRRAANKRLQENLKRMEDDENK